MSPEIVNMFAEHGLAGLVIAVLFFMIFVLIKVLTKKDAKFIEHLRASSAECTATMQEILADEREERKEVRADNKKSHGQLSKAIDGLAEGLRGIEK